MEIELRAQLYAPPATVMSFLNEAVQRFPEAISLAPGRPIDEHLGVESGLEALHESVAASAEEAGLTVAAAFDRLGQYGDTAGSIRKLIATHLERDEGIRVGPEAVLVTSGCQEAMAILLTGLVDPSRDTLLISDPTYVGISGLAGMLSVPTHPVPASWNGIEPEAFETAVAEVRRSGRRPRALYVIPDFDNPLGTCLQRQTREEILAIAERHGVLVFEDNPYRMFRYEGPAEPSLKALDGAGVVIYLGSFSKTLFPGLRLGYLVADQPAKGPDGQGGTPLASELARVKSYTTVNTPPLLQALAGALLQRHEGSLAPIVQAKLPAYRERRDRMLAALERAFGSSPDASGVSWNRPRGGFFLTLTLPFPFEHRCLLECAERYGVICCPMSFFAAAPGREHQVRLSFSYAAPDRIDEGIERLARFVRDRTAGTLRSPVTVPPASAASEA